MRFLVAFAAWLALPTVSGWTEMLSFDSAEKWQSWTMPAGLVQVDAEGVLRLTKYRKEVDAIRDAHLFTHSTQNAAKWQAESGRSAAEARLPQTPSTAIPRPSGNPTRPTNSKIGSSISTWAALYSPVTFA